MDKPKIILRPLKECHDELIRNFAGGVNRSVIMCCENVFRQYEGLNIRFNSITEYLDNLNESAEFLYCDLNSRGKLVKMLQNRELSFEELD